MANWILFSTRESIDTNVLSVTAIVETLIAIPAFWWTTIEYQTYLPLIISVAVAPLVLLRSEQSVALGVRWYTALMRPARLKLTAVNKALIVTVPPVLISILSHFMSLNVSRWIT